MPYTLVLTSLSKLDIKDPTDLILPTMPTSTARGSHLRVQNGPVSKLDDSDTVSLHSRRSTTHSLTASMHNPVHSVVCSMHSTISHTSTATGMQRVPPSLNSLCLDSKLMPANISCMNFAAEPDSAKTVSARTTF